MSGAAVIWYLIKTNSAVLAVVPAARIKAGILPIDTVLPAIGASDVDGIPRLTVAMNEPNRMHTDRVQVTVEAKDYPAKKSLLALVLAACPNTHGAVNGIDVLDIRPDTLGPDLDDPATQIYTQSRDFIVRWRG